ncbi:MAG: hypothetical protein MT490_03935 [Sphingomonas sp.]|uniref:hypothetical protein n=1 Tax=Sphingomonas sp. TaxID=28214 RepID=UPI002274FD4B|nr:hypothetical protein [Sphingomonas sp.]MCX8474929.1 hypothetical protein [Sphingomonas sp.]
MRSVKLAIGIAFALMPLVYCGALFFYFLDTAGSVQDAVGIGLGPTLFGVGAIGVLFCVPVAWKILRALHTPRVRATNPEAPAPDDSSFDADAALARYLARKSAEAEGDAVSPRTGPAAPRPGFGRKGI